MINPIVKSQLAQCRIANIPDISENSPFIIIQKEELSTPSGMVVGSTYLIELENYCLSQTFDFHTSWNNGRTPASKYIKAYITEVREKIFCFDGVGTNYDGDATNPDMYFKFWLPTKSIRILRRLN